MLQRVLDIEQRRIDSADRRTAVALEAIKASDEANKRQFDFRMAKLQADSEAGRQRHALARQVLIGRLLASVLSSRCLSA